jgi:hypothetical protein
MGSFFGLSRIADASISEEPGAGKLHAGICAGAVGQLAVLPRWLYSKHCLSELILQCNWPHIARVEDETDRPFLH